MSMQLRPARPKDLKVCATLDHSYSTDHVWQMEVRQEGGAVASVFREASLPREIKVEYPRQGASLVAGWKRRDGFMVVEDGDAIRGYVALTAQEEHGIAWVGDLVVDRSWRRRGLGTMLLQAAVEWGRGSELDRLVVEVPTKNYPAIRFCQSRGLAFCGYSDRYWLNYDIALFFGESL
jgi:GNAT superfamily N-acetyltransferase